VNDVCTAIHFVNHAPVVASHMRVVEASSQMCARKPRDQCDADTIVIAA
jgi:hypothetical protein